MSSSGEWSRDPERGSTWIIWLGLKLLQIGGYWFGLVVTGLGVVYFFLTGRSSRRASRTYLSHLFRSHPRSAGPPSALKVLRHHWHFGVTVMDRLWLWQDKLEQFEITIVGREAVHAKRDGGVLLLGAHMGSFDVMRALSAAREVPVNVVMYRANAAKFNAVIKKMNPRANIRIFDLDGSDVGRIFELKEALDRGESVALLADRMAPYGKPRTCSTMFLGEKAAFPQNPWILAHLLQCPVFLAVGLRTGMRRYLMKVELLAERVVLPRKTRGESLQGYIDQYAAHLEQLCAEHPYQWFNFFEFWRSESEPEPPESN